MHNKINKILFSIVLFLIIIFGVLLITKNEKEYSKTFEYMDTYIEVKIYSNNKNKAISALNKINELYKEYSILTDKYNQYDNIINLYYIHNNTDDDEYLKINEKLYNLIKYAIDFYEETNGYFDISFGNVLDLWHDYRTYGMGVPTQEELETVHFFDKKIILDKDYTILNNHVNIDLGGIAKGYVTNEVKKYLEQEKLTSYLINAGGNVVVGDYYKKQGVYKIGIEDPSTGGIFKIVKGNNISVITSGSYQRYYEVDGILYSHIISPKTLYPTNYSKSVTVICKDSAYGDILSTYLFLIPVDEGISYIESIPDVEAIWYIGENEIKMTSGFKDYIYE